MNTKLVEHLLAFLLVCIATGCRGVPVAPGGVLELQPGATMAGVQSVLSGSNPYGMILVRDGVAVVAWPQSGGWAWACIKCGAADAQGLFRYLTGGKGNIADAGDFSGMVNYLKENGWQELPGAGLPAAGSWLAAMGGSIPSMLLLPIGKVPEEWIERPQS
jgi:hypothetical protein